MDVRLATLIGLVIIGLPLSFACFSLVTWRMAVLTEQPSRGLYNVMASSLVITGIGMLALTFASTVIQMSGDHDHLAFIIGLVLWYAVNAYAIAYLVMKYKKLLRLFVLQPTR